MAELAGTIIGGIGLAALFTTCVDAFELIDAGRTFGPDYQRAALKLSLLELRLSRWGQTVRFQDSSTGSAVHGVVVASDREAEKVRELLEEISATLEDARRAAGRYTRKDSGQGLQPVQPVQGRGEVVVLVDRARDMARRRSKATSFLDKARWALHDQKKMGRLLDDLDGFVSDLTTLFPASIERQQSLCRQDAVEMIRPSAIEEPEDEKTGRTEQLILAAEEVDQDMQVALQTLLPPSFSHTFKNIENTDDARMQNGDLIGEGQFTMGAGHLYEKIKGSGRSRTMNGNVYTKTVKGAFD